MKSKYTLKILLKQILGRDPWSRVEITCKWLDMGGWILCPVGIDDSSIVFSLGVGGNIDFDIKLIESYGCNVHAFDPTPRWIDWIKDQKLPDDFHFYPYAIGGKDGQMKLYPRMPRGRRSSTMLTVMNEGLEEGEGITVSVKRLITLISELGASRIDILKMDIEAAEYEVLDDLLNSEIPVYQILVEFHHRFASVPVQNTRKALQKLYRSGYRIFHISPKGREFSFIHKETYDRVNNIIKPSH
jgi:FkbM family methyltransferase